MVKRKARYSTGERRRPASATPGPAKPGSRLAAWLVLGGLAAYSWLFFNASLPSIFDPELGRPLRRFELYKLLLLFPERYWEAWFGSPARLSLLDRLPIALTAAALVGVSGMAGWLLLRLTRAATGLSRLETVVFSLGIGFNAVSLYVLAVGLAGWLRHAWVFVAPGAGVLVGAAIAARRLEWGQRREITDGPVNGTAAGRELGPRWLWLGAPFAMAILLAAMLPPADFDVREYHLQAPKEFFLEGQIRFLPHNVYANMPLGMEILSLPAMSVWSDWWLGALVGKTILGLFAPLGALAVYCAGRRWYSPLCATVAALVYVSTPWIARVCGDGLIEGASAFYLFLAWYGIRLWREGQGEPGWKFRWLLISGWLAGAAAACKYPGMIFVVLPLAVVVLFDRFATREGLLPSLARLNWRPLAMYLLATVAACGLWYGKNWGLTGNPTYPLLYEVFNGRTRNPDLNARWVRVHHPPNFALSDLAGRVADVAWRSEWLNPLAAPLAGLALASSVRRRQAAGPLLFFGFVLVAWWLLTHRIDRFWIPALPLLSLAAGIGAAGCNTEGRLHLLRGLLVTGLFLNLALVTGVAYNRYFLPLHDLRSDPQRVDPWHLYFNGLQGRASVLLVGDAAVFDLQPPVLYNTVFDESILEQIARNRPTREIQDELDRLGVGYVYVNWSEIGRYRSPGNYGFTDFITPELFDTLIKQGVLRPALEPLEGSAGQVYPVARPPHR